MTTSVSSLNESSFVAYQLLNGRFNSEAATTSSDVINSYTNGITPFSQALKALEDNPDQIAAIAATYAPSMNQAVTNLINLATTGISKQIDPTDPNSPTTPYYLTHYMGDGLNALLQSLTAAGATITTNGNNPPTVSITAANVATWLSAANSGVSDIVQQCEDSTGLAQHSFQAAVELQYVAKANNQLSTDLSDLYSALQIANQTLGDLNSVLALHNQVSLSTNPAITYPTQSQVNGSYEKWLGEYEANATSAFAPIFIKFNFTSTDNSPGGVQFQELTQAYDQMVKVQNTLANDLTEMAAPGGPGTSSDIYQKVNTVYQGLVAATAAGPPDPQGNPAYYNPDFYNWFIDGWQGGAQTGSGAIAQNINFAITSSQSFNDTQTQKVQEDLYTYEQFIQSATSMLTNYSDIVIQAGQAIGR